MIKGTQKRFYLRSIKGFAAKLASNFIGTADGFVEVTTSGENVANADYVAPVETFEVISEATADGGTVQFSNE